MQSDREPPREDLTQFLLQLGLGHRDRADELMPYVYAELKAIALASIRHRDERTLQATALVNEAFLKLFDQDRLDVNDRQHFFRLAAKAMRQLLIDHARQRKAEKRGGDRNAVTLDEAVAAASGFDFDWLDLDAALSQLEQLDERQARVVELRYFAGLEVAAVAGVLGVSKSTVEQEWRTARAWLGMRLRGSQPE